MQTLSSSIDIVTFCGVARGFRSGAGDSAACTYFTDHGVRDEGFIEALRSRSFGIVVLKTLHVDMDERGCGFGTALLNAFLSQAGNEPVLLIADVHEEQEAGFNLVEWYERHGFVRVQNTGLGPVLVYPAALCAEAGITEQLARLSFSPLPGL